MALPFRTIVLNITTCIECPKHQLIEDAHATDRARADDVAVVCSICPNLARNLESAKSTDHSPHRVVAAGCAPDKVDLQAGVPDWCPLWHKDLFLGG
jgi:hypothetical protein